MPMTDQQRTDAKTLLGPKAKDFDDDQLSGALLETCQTAYTINENLSRANGDLQAELDAAVPAEVIELSAAVRNVAVENVSLRVERLKARHKLPDAFAQKIQNAFSADNVIMLSANSTAEQPAITKQILDLLDEWPVTAAAAPSLVRGEQTGPQAETILMSRAETTDPTGTTAEGDTKPDAWANFMPKDESAATN